MFAVSRSCWVTGGSVTRCAAKNVQEIYWLHCSQGARVDIFFKFGNWTENIELFVTEMYPC